jgi:hypothetical protein
LTVSIGETFIAEVLRGHGFGINALW